MPRFMILSYVLSTQATCSFRKRAILFHKLVDIGGACVVENVWGLRRVDGPK